MSTEGEDRLRSLMVFNCKRDIKVDYKMDTDHFDKTYNLLVESLLFN